MSIHIFTVSAAIVGVCLTVIGSIRAVIAFRTIDTIVGALLGIDVFLFGIACLLSYPALPTS